MRSGMTFHAGCWGYQDNRLSLSSGVEETGHRTTVWEELGQEDAGPTSD